MAAYPTWNDEDPANEGVREIAATTVDSHGQTASINQYYGLKQIYNEMLRKYLRLLTRNSQNILTTTGIFSSNTMMNDSTLLNWRDSIDNLRGIADSQMADAGSTGPGAFSWNPAYYQAGNSADDATFLLEHLTEIRTALSYDFFELQYDTILLGATKGYSIYNTVTGITTYHDYLSSGGFFNWLCGVSGNEKARTYFKYQNVQEFGTVTAFRYLMPTHSNTIRCYLNKNGVPMSGNASPGVNDVLVHTFAPGSYGFFSFSNLAGFTGNTGSVTFTMISENDINGVAADDQYDLQEGVWASDFEPILGYCLGIST